MGFYPNPENRADPAAPGIASPWGEMNELLCNGDTAATLQRSQPGLWSTLNDKYQPLTLSSPLGRSSRVMILLYTRGNRGRGEATCPRSWREDWQRQEQESKPPPCQSSALITKKPLPSLSFSPAHPPAAVQSSILRIEGKNTEILIRVHLHFSEELREQRHHSVRD